MTRCLRGPSTGIHGVAWSRFSRGIGRHGIRTYTLDDQNSGQNSGQRMMPVAHVSRSRRSDKTKNASIFPYVVRRADSNPWRRRESACALAESVVLSSDVTASTDARRGPGDQGHGDLAKLPPRPDGHDATARHRLGLACDLVPPRSGARVIGHLSLLNIRYVLWPLRLRARD